MGWRKANSGAMCGRGRGRFWLMQAAENIGRRECGAASESRAGSCSRTINIMGETKAQKESFGEKMPR